MMVTLEIANRMPESLDAEIMGEYIVVECSDGYWACKQYQPSASVLDDVKWYPAYEWMVKRFKSLQGTGLARIEAAQLRDEEIARLAKESWDEREDRGFSFEDAMPGASSDEWHDVDFNSYVGGYYV